MEYLIGVRWLVGVVFAAAVVGKVQPRRWRPFAAAVADFAAVPAGWSRPIAVAIVAVEAAVVGLVAGPATARFGLALAAAVLAVFGAGIVWALRRGVQSRCPCFGAAGAVLGKRHAARNAVLALLVGTAAAAPPGSPPVVHAVIAAVTGILAGILVISADALTDLYGAPTRVAGRA